MFFNKVITRMMTCTYVQLSFRLLIVDDRTKNFTSANFLIHFIRLYEYVYLPSEHLYLNEWHAILSRHESKALDCDGRDLFSFLFLLFIIIIYIFFFVEIFQVQTAKFLEPRLEGYIRARKTITNNSIDFEHCNSNNIIFLTPTIDRAS